MTIPTPRFLDAGEAALVVEFGAIVDPLANDYVLTLDEALTSLAVLGVLETVPTYRSLMIHYDPLVLDRETLIAKIRTIEARPRSPRRPKNCWTIPCCYESPFGEDLSHIAEAAGVTQAQVVALHSVATFRAYMYGFAPGCCYLGGLPTELAISRRPIPRPPYAPNSILVAGGLSLISTFSMPTGWWVIGRTPVRMFSQVRDPIFLVQIGDLVRFKSIDKEEFDSFEQRSTSGELVAERETLR
jgi:KipI family sensor histidine kinase inhibitor